MSARKILLSGWLAAIVIAAIFAPGVSAAGGAHKWKFPPTINAPWAREADNEDFDTPLAAAGLCRSNPFNTTGAYGALGSNVDAIVNDPVNNSGFSSFGCRTAQNETTIAVNPTNPNNLIAGANDYRVCCDFTGLNDGTGWAYYSFDGGKTWGNVQLPHLTAETGASGQFKKLDSAGDPVVAFGPDGTAYYANIAFSRVSPASGIVISVSTDGGKTWGEPNMIAFGNAPNFFNDKVWMAAGPHGQVVVTWSRFSQGPHGAGYLESPIVGAYSGDHGKTWNRQGFPVSDAAHPFDQGSQIAFGTDGAIYVAYEAGSPTTGYATDAVVLARSTDGGLTFTTKELARIYDDNDCYPVFAGRPTLTDMHFRLNSYPSMKIDPVTGEIAIAWTDNEGSGTCGTGGSSFTGTTSNQVKLMHGTWATIGAVTALTSTAPDKVFPAVTNFGGKIAVSYYTRDYGITSLAPSARSVCLDYASLSSGDGFATQTRLSTESSNPFVQFADGAFIGDYSEIALGSDGVAHAAWTDFRGNPGITPANQDVMIQNFTP